jgi:hypothetical protein
VRKPTLFVFKRMCAYVCFFQVTDSVEEALEAFTVQLEFSLIPYPRIALPRRPNACRSRTRTPVERAASARARPSSSPCIARPTC